MSKTLIGFISLSVLGGIGYILGLYTLQPHLNIISTEVLGAGIAGTGALLIHGIMK